MSFRRIMRRSGDSVSQLNFNEMDEVTRRLDINPLLDGNYFEVKVGKGDEIVIPHGLGREYRGFICTTHSGLMADKTAKDKRRRLTLRCQHPANLIEEKVVAADTTDVTFTNLDGNKDEAYYWEAEWIGGSNNERLRLHPNGSTTNWESNYLQVDGTAYSDGVFTTENFVGSTANSDEKTYASGWIYTKTGNDRHSRFSSVTQDSTAADSFFQHGSGWWNDTTTEVTSLEFSSSSTDDILEGSIFRLYRRGLNGETVGVWVF